MYPMFNSRFVLATALVCCAAAGAADGAPTISLVLPNEGPWTGGTRVVIVGTGLLTATSVTFGDVTAASVRPLSDITIEARSPAASGPGLMVDITVATSEGEVTLAGGFTFTEMAGEGEGEGEPVDGAGCFGGESPSYCGTMTAYGQKALIPQTVVCCVWDAESGAAILDAVLKLAGPTSDATVTGSLDGTYTFSSVEAGAHTIHLSVPGVGTCGYAFFVDSDEMLVLTFPVGESPARAAQPGAAGMTKGHIPGRCGDMLTTLLASAALILLSRTSTRGPAARKRFCTTT